MGQRDVLFSYLAFLCLAVIHVEGNDGAIPSSEATEIGKIICTPEEFHDDKWFKCIECCQSINAYHLVCPFVPLCRVIH